MNLATVSIKNTRRNSVRTVLTVLAVAVSMVAFLLLRTVFSAWITGSEYSAKDRIATRHKVTFAMPMPRRYVDEVGQVQDVNAVTWFNWCGAKLAAREDQVFNTLATDPRSFFAVYDEIDLPEDQKARFIGNRTGAIVGARLAQRLGFKVGDQVRLEGTLYPGLWEFTIDGIYSSQSQSVDQGTFYFHWDYLNERQPASNRDMVGWIASKVANAGQAAVVSKRIDAHFGPKDIQTISMSERQMTTSFIGMMSTLLNATQVVSLVILLIVMMILGNTIAMGVRERAREYAVLRALGFAPVHLSALVLSEATLLGLCGGLLGLLLAYPLIDRGIGRFMEANFTFLFPHFRIEPLDAGLALLLSIGLAVAAALWPARKAGSVQIIDALRKVG